MHCPAYHSLRRGTGCGIYWFNRITYDAALVSFSDGRKAEAGNSLGSSLGVYHAPKLAKLAKVNVPPQFHLIYNVNFPITPPLLLQFKSPECRLRKRC